MNTDFSIKKIDDYNIYLTDWKMYDRIIQENNKNCLIHINRMEQLFSIISLFPLISEKFIKV